MNAAMRLFSQIIDSRVPVSYKVYTLFWVGRIFEREILFSSLLGV